MMALFHLVVVAIVVELPHCHSFLQCRRRESWRWRGCGGRVKKGGGGGGGGGWSCCQTQMKIQQQVSGRHRR